MNLIFAFDIGSIRQYCRSKFHSCYALLGFILTWMILLTSCNSKKYLVEGQSFLHDNNISIKSKHPVPNKSDLYENLSLRYRQPAIRYVFGIPRYVFYYQYQRSLARNPNRKKWDEERLIKNRPVIYDSLKAQQTTEEFDHYLGIRGYRYANVTFKAKTRAKETIVYYKVDPGPLMYVDTFIIASQDTAIQRIIEENIKESEFKNRTPLDIVLYNKEKQRIITILQNEGYATLDETYIPPLEVDSSNQKIKATMRVLNPSDSTFHLKYYVGEVTIFPNYDVVESPQYFDTTVHGVHYFILDSTEFTLKPEAIERNLFVHEGQLTRREDLQHTIKNLGRIELIKFVNAATTIDTSGFVPLMDYTFYLSRNKKINFDFNAELTYSNIASEEKKSLFGTALGATYHDRNLFKGAEVFNLTMDLGFDFNFFNNSQITSGDILNSFNLGLGSNLSFQRFIDPLRMYRMIGFTKDPEKKALIGDKLHNWLTEDASTRLSLGTSYVRITNLYEYFTLNANLNYDVQPDPFRKLTINRMGFDLFIPTAYEEYQEILDSNIFLRESFGNQLYTGFLFRNYLFEVNSKSKSRTGYFKMLHSVEVSGFEMYLINSTANLISGNDKEIVLNPGSPPDEIVEFSQFAKGEIDVRYYRDFGRKTQFAIKFNTGVASRFGPYTKQVPYPKQFFVGGALSNRAWQIRELGPGGYEDLTPHDPSLPFYQTGDFKIDISAEFRFPLIWYLEGATFIDAANVWILNADNEADIDHLIDEFGVGYGFGLRLDLDYFTLRLDFGFKLHNPFPVPYESQDGPKRSRWLVDELKRFPGGGEPQIAVGFPF